MTRVARGWVGQRARTIAWSSAIAVAFAVALPAVWWEPLHVDEWVTLSVAPRSLGAIVSEVVVRRGGGPVHFFVEHVFLEWPGGVEGLRLPSVAAFGAALPAVGLLARELAGMRESLLTPAFLASAPLAVALASFGRMYALFLATFLWLAVAAVRVAVSGGPRLLAVSAGLGALVYVHPIAPVYAGPALAGALFLGRVRPRPALCAAAAFAAAGLPYWLHSLWRLRERYYVGYAGSERLETTAGRSVPEESLLALGGGAWFGAIFLAALAAVGAIALWRRGRAREVAVLLALVLTPVAFFALVPAGDVEAGGTRFYARYLLPALPELLLLVAAGCLAAPRVVAAGLAAVVLGFQANEDWERLGRLRALRLMDAVALVQALGDDAVLLPATGRAVAGSGRPAHLLDEFLALEAPDSRPEGPGIRVRLVGGPPRYLNRVARSAPASLVAHRISPRILLIRSRPESPLVGSASHQVSGGGGI